MWKGDFSNRITKSDSYPYSKRLQSERGLAPRHAPLTALEKVVQLPLTAPAPATPSA